MPLDEDQGNPVARVRALTPVRWCLAILLLCACGPKVRPDWADEPKSDEPAPAAKPTRQGAAPGAGVLVGEMCLEGAAGRPGVAPLLLHSVGWTAYAEDVENALARSVHAFAVLGLDGTRAGIFEVLGAADVGLPEEVAIGSYSGRSPCAPESEDGGALADQTCVDATASCGVAVARVDDSGADEVPELDTGTACISGDSLLVDVDGDGASESFPIGTFIDGVRAPAEEVLASPVVGPQCNASFAIYGVTIVPEPEDPKAPDDPRYHVVIDIAGVVDVDGDGRREVIVSFHYEEGRTFAIYSAMQQAGRLELVGEAVPWQ